MSAGALKILHVDDDPSQTYLMQNILKSSLRQPYELTEARTLTAALVKLAGAPFDVVLLDLGLPDSRGLESFDAVKANAPGCAIIVFTGESDTAVAMHALQSGAQDYLVKGEVDRNSVARAIRYATERKRVERALGQERDLLQSLIESLPDHIYVKDETGHFIRANSAVASFLGTTPEVMQGKTDYDYFPHGLARQFFDEEQRVIHSGQMLVNREAAVSGKDGDQRWIITTKAPLRDHRGRTVGIVGINRDITALKKTQEEMKRANDDLRKAHEDLRAAQLQLVEAEKLRTIGRLAAGIAHEVKNPLAIMLRGIGYLSKSAVAQDATVAAVLHDMRDAIGRADGVIRGLLDYSAPQGLETTEEDVNRTIEESLLFVRHELDEARVAVVRHLEPSLPPCLFDRRKLHEVFINVFENAGHAMRAGGTLTVRTSSKILAGIGANVGDSDADRFKVGDRLIVVEIDDTGTGIPPDKLDKVFDPFFTTKPTGQGTGLGLSVCKTIVDLHGGTIQIHNRDGGGVRVTLTLKACK